MTGGEQLERRLALSVSAESDLDAVSRSLDLGHPQSPTCGCAGCALPPPDAIAFSAMQLPTAAAFPLSETFQLHSRPEASKRIYLDFDGHTAVGTAWGNPIVTPAYSLDANYDAFSNAELSFIQEIWARVVEDFAPFDVDVTTEEPSAADLINAGGGDRRWGVRVVVGGDGAWLPGAAGVAFLNGFGRSDLAPAFAFADQSWKTNANFAAVVISHEVGHTLGLNHHGYQGSEYYGGRGNWGPLMGNPSRLLTQWSKGDYGGATRPQQDDLQIITTRAGNGFGYRPDDHGNTPDTATTYAGGQISGLIERNDDVDLVRFYTSSRIVAEIRPASVGANLDILAEILDSSGLVIATSDPQGSLAANFETTVAAGTYYLRVRGTGQGDPATTGYSSYGSLGQYTMSLTVDSIPTIDSIEDRVGTTRGLVFSGGRTNDPSPLVRGSGPPGATVTLKSGGQAFGASAVAADGRWSIEVSPALADGIHEILASDSFGGMSAEAYTVVVDTKAPGVPAIVAVYDDQGTIQGRLRSGSRTDDSELQIEGTAPPGSLVTVYGNGGPLGSVVASREGNWVYTTSVLVSAVYGFTATSSDDVGNESGRSDPPWSVTVDTRLPAVPAITGVVDGVQPNLGNVADGGVTNDTFPTFSGTGDPGSIIRLTSDGMLVGQAAVDRTGRWQVKPYNPLNRGPYVVVAEATNEIGAESGLSLPYGLTVDTTPPTLTIERTGGGTLAIGASSLIRFKLSESITAFSAAVVVTTGGSLVGFSGSGATYTATFIPTVGFEGTGSIVVPEGAFLDEVGYGNRVATLNIPIDTAKPSVAIAIDGPAVLKVGDSATVRLVLSEPTEDLTAGDIRVSGGTISELTGAGTTYTATFFPAQSFHGTATISVVADTFTDLAGNRNLGSSMSTIEVDTVAPTLTISRLRNGSLKIGDSDTIAFTLSEDTTDFTAADITVIGGSIAHFQGSGTTYTATLIPAAGFQGTSEIRVPAGVFTDPNGNSNLVASLGLPIDTQRPTLTIRRSHPVALKIGDTATISLSASEPVAGLTLGDLAVTGGSIVAFSGSGTNYNAIFTPAPMFNGIATVTFAAGSFSDLVGNTNLVTDVLEMPVDTIAPRITIERYGAGTLKVGDTARVSFNVSEPTTDLTIDDIALTGGTITGFTGSGASYSATFIPAIGFHGRSSIAVPAGRFTDASGNVNDAAAVGSIDVDTIAPRVLGFRTSAATAVLGVGDSISIVADLSEPISRAAGTFTIFFDSGGRTVLTVDPSGTSASGVYTAEPGEVSEDLIVKAIVPNGTIRDLPGNLLSASLPAPATNLAVRYDIAVEATVRFVDQGVFSTDPSVVPDAGRQYRRIRIRFTTPVVGVSLSRLIVTRDGTPLSLRGAVLRGRGADYDLLLPVSRMSPVGLYTLAIRPESGIRAVSNRAQVDHGTSLHWGYRRSRGMVPDAPSELFPQRVTRSGSRAVVTLGWPVPAGNGAGSPTGYEVHYREAGNDQWQAVRGPIPPSASPTAEIGGLAMGGQYEFRVAARNAAGRGDFAVSPVFTVQVGPTGHPLSPFLTPLEAHGEVTLAHDARGNLYANGMPITLKGVPVIRDPSETAVWRFLAADVIDGVKTLVLQHSAGALRLWRMDSSWAHEYGEGWFAPGTEGHSETELLFGMDFDDDGLVGPGTIESAGSVSLSYDAELNLRANGTRVTLSGAPVKYDPSPTATWKFRAADVVGGVNKLVLEHASGYLRIWNMNSSWGQVSGEGWYAPGSPGYRAVEASFGMDFDGNGSVGA